MAARHSGFGVRHSGQAVRATALGLALAICAACSPQPSAPPPAAGTGEALEQARLSMGSELRLTAWTSDRAAADAAFAAVFAEFDRLEALMSTWRPMSDISRLNAAAGERPVPVSPEVRELLHTAHEVGDWTSGKFDITFGALADVWRFDHDQDNQVPPPAAIAERLPLIDYRALQVDDAAGTAFLARKGMRANLGGIGKGYAVDRGAAILRAHRIADFMIQAGGDLYVGGRRGDRPWRLGIRDPRGPADRIFAAIDLENATFSTSGDYERFFIAGGRRYHHIIDPATGEPATRCRSVTIVSPRAVIADAVAKGVFILCGQEGLRLIEQLPDVEGVIVTAKNEVLVSSGLKDRIAIVATPTDIAP